MNELRFTKYIQQNGFVKYSAHCPVTGWGSQHTMTTTEYYGTLAPDRAVIERFNKEYAKYLSGRLAPLTVDLPQGRLDIMPHPEVLKIHPYPEEYYREASKHLLTEEDV